MQNIVEEYRLPGGYFSTMVDEEEAARSTLPLAIVSSVLFPGHSGTMGVKRPYPRLSATTLPGAWVQEVIVDERSTATGTAELKKDDEESDDNATQQQQSEAAAAAAEKEKTAAELRRTVAKLRQQAEQLEQTDRMVKKGLEIIAHKRVLVQHKRRRRSQWDWCDDADDDDDDDDKSTSSEEEKDVRTVSRSKQSAAEEDGWVWIEEETTKTSKQQ